MKNFEEMITDFEQTFDKQYIDTWLECIKTNKIKYLYFYLSDDNTVLTYSDRLNVGSYICSLSFNPIEFNYRLIEINSILEKLTEKDKLAYINKQTSLLDNDDYMFYNITEIMISWLKHHAYYAIEDAILSILIERKNEFKKTDVYKTMIELFKNNMHKQRDIKSELELEVLELTKKIDKLEKFIKANKIFETLSEEMKTAMKKQYKAMNEYAKQLFIRIELLKENRK